MAVVVAAAIVAAPIVLTAIAGVASTVAAASSVAAVTAVATTVADTTLTAAVAITPAATAITAVVPTFAAVVTTVTRAICGSGEYPYAVQEGDTLNRVYDVKGSVPYNGYSGIYGGSYCPGDVQTPLSASQQIITRGLNPDVNSADMTAIFRATQDIPAVLRTSVDGMNPEIVIDPLYLDYLEVIETLQNEP
jgi:hypothetical protein